MYPAASLCSESRLSPRSVLTPEKWRQSDVDNADSLKTSDV